VLRSSPSASCVINVAFQPHGAVEAGPAPPEVDRGIGFGDETFQPRKVARQLDVQVNDLSVGVGVEHDPRPSGQPPRR
jgi:hypothetical protein